MISNARNIASSSSSASGRPCENGQLARVRIIGDIPIFVAHDSAEVWAQRAVLPGPRGNPTVVAGVPPDYFRAPAGDGILYRWAEHATDGYAWWVKRMQAVLSLVDIVRLDHFRGFAGYWEVPASAKTAESGRWVPGPGSEFFEAIEKAFGDLPIIAEDLGEITPDVVELRQQFDLPGMRIVQFAFNDDPSDPFLPHNYTQNGVSTPAH
jgi:4-alpha-glucanotransferase